MNTITTLLDSKMDEFIARFKNGESIANIADEYGISFTTIYKRMKKMGIKAPGNRKFKAELEHYKDKILTDFDSGKSANSIAKELGISCNVIIRLLKQFNRDTSRYNNRKTILLKDHLDEVLRMYKNGKGATTIARELGYNASSVCDLLRKHKGKLKGSKKYSIDETFFKKIDNEVKAYIFGLISSDGNLSESRDGLRFSIGLQEVDVHILQRIKNEMQYYGPLYYCNKSHLKNHQNTFVLQIGNKRLFKQLIKLGCTPKKSHTLKFPTKEQVPEEFFWSFIRGFLDGNGSIYLNKRKKRFMVNIAGSNPFIAKLSKTLFNRYDIHNTVYKCAIRNISILHIYRKDTIKIFLDRLYKNATIFLERKFAKYRLVCATKKELSI